MTTIQTCSCSINLVPCPKYHHFKLITTETANYQRTRPSTVLAAKSKSGGFSLNSVFNKCERCGGQGAIECPGCKGTGKNKKNGNIFERWKCYDCQGFGLKSCPVCGKGGLTPEQRGER